MGDVLGGFGTGEGAFSTGQGIFGDANNDDLFGSGPLFPQGGCCVWGFVAGAVDALIATHCPADCVFEPPVPRLVPHLNRHRCRGTWLSTVRGRSDHSLGILASNWLLQSVCCCHNCCCCWCWWWCWFQSWRYPFEPGSGCASCSCWRCRWPSHHWYAMTPCLSGTQPHKHTCTLMETHPPCCLSSLGLHECMATRRRSDGTSRHC